VKNDRVSIVWTQFSGLMSYYYTRAQDPEKLKSIVVEVIALETCDGKIAQKRARHQICSELKKILCELDHKLMLQTVGEEASLFAMDTLKMYVFVF
jgi:RNA exonuclease 1